MTDPIADLSSARILVTNDDGIHAPGLKALERIAKKLSPDVWVVAPETEQSAVAHSLTLRRPLRHRKLSRRRFSVDGTPTDCVLVAQKMILEQHPADIVLSGINHGVNLGEDVTYSGTIAAAFEGALLGVKSIALSQQRGANGAIHWSAAEHFAPDIVRKLAAESWPRDVLMNVNFPDLTVDKIKGVTVCRQGRRKSSTTVIRDQDPSGRPCLWIGDYPNEQTLERRTDLAAVEAGMISVTPLHLDLTHRKTLQGLSGLFE